MSVSVCTFAPVKQLNLVQKYRIYKVLCNDGWVVCTFDLVQFVYPRNHLVYPLVMQLNLANDFKPTCRLLEDHIQNQIQPFKMLAHVFILLCEFVLYSHHPQPRRCLRRQKKAKDLEYLSGVIAGYCKADGVAYICCQRPRAPRVRRRILVQLHQLCT